MNIKSVVNELTKAIAELLAEVNKHPSDIINVDSVIGGDHGIGAFILCFRVIIKLKNGNFIHRQFK